MGDCVSVLNIKKNRIKKCFFITTGVQQTMATMDAFNNIQLFKKLS
jgi:hypothetical protein